MLGCRHSTGIYVIEFIEVPDHASTRTSYVRSSATATKELEGRIGQQPEGSLPGYVGEWHTHPERQGPSRTDRNQIKEVSKRSEGEVALMVITLDPCSSQWVPTGLCAKSGRTRQAAIEIRTTGDPYTEPARTGGPQ